MKNSEITTLKSVSEKFAKEYGLAPVVYGQVEEDFEAPLTVLWEDYEDCNPDYGVVGVYRLVSVKKLHKTTTVLVDL